MSKESLEEARYLKIRYTNGTEKTFAFRPLEGKVDLTTLMTHLHRALDSRRLLLQMEDRMMVIPFDNLESIEVIPSPTMTIADALQVIHEFN